MLKEKNVIINIHGHPTANILKQMDKEGIDISVLLAGRGNNYVALEMARQHPDRFIPFYWVELDDPELAVLELERGVKRDSFRGVKFQPLVQRFYPHDRRLDVIYRKCIELDIPVLFHTGVVPVFPGHYNEFANPLPLDEVAERFPELVIFLGHMGGNYSYEALVTAEKHQNIYLETAFLPTFCARFLPPVEPIDIIKRAVKFLGPERVLYGYEGLSPKVILDSDLAEEAKQKILCENAKRLLKLK